MKIRIPTKAVLWLLILPLALLARIAVAAEGDIPKISIPPTAEYLARGVHEKYVAYCKAKLNCLPKIGFDAGNGDGAIFGITRDTLDGPLIITEEAGPARPRRSGRGMVINRITRKTLIIGSDGILKRAKQAFSKDDFESVEREENLDWDIAITLLDTADQLIRGLAEHEEQMRERQRDPSVGRDI